MTWREALLAALALAASMIIGEAKADVRIVVPYAVGGTADLMARFLAPGLQQQLGETIVIDNRGGAGGALGNEAVVRAAPDGRTLLVANMGSHVIAPLVQPPTGYDQAKAFEPIMLIGTVPALMVIRPSLPATTLAELIAFAKAGHKLTYGSSGRATTMHVAGELVNAEGGIKATHLPYRGLGPAMNDLLGGHVDMLIADLPVLIPQVKAGRIRALALFAPERSPLLPDVPSTRELGFPMMTMENWYGVLVRAGTPTDAISRLEQAALAIVAASPVREQLADAGVLGVQGRAAFKARLDRDFAHWGPAVKTLGITGE
jgi:tripartite-type tricarboxylate transporter receptor subunit TctC